SFHFLWPSNLKGVSWTQIELKLKSMLVDEKCPLFVYSNTAVTGVTWKPKKKKKGLIQVDSDADEGSEGDPEEEEDDDSDSEDSAVVSFTTDHKGPLPPIYPTASADDIFHGKSILSYGLPSTFELQSLVMCEGGRFAAAEQQSVSPGVYTHIVTEQAWD